jgi:hypothetical protein
MMGCDHDLCLPCSVAAYTRHRRPDGVICEFCGKLTELDEETIEKLTQVKGRGRGSGVGAGGRGGLAYHPEDKPVRAQAREPPLNLSQLKRADANCGEHPDEGVMYFCFECCTSPVCPECVVHGRHKNHEVKTIKKAVPEVRTLLQGQGSSLQSKMTVAQASREEFERRSAQVVEMAKQSKKAIQSKFETIKARLFTKEKEILARYDQLLQDILEGYRADYSLVEREYAETSRQIELIGESTRLDPIPFLDFYVQNKTQI